jgi:hypothetical protein
MNLKSVVGSRKASASAASFRLSPFTSHKDNSTFAVNLKTAVERLEGLAATAIA